MFKKALTELGHNPKDFEGKKLPLQTMCEIYQFEEDEIIKIIENKKLSAHYDYQNDSIWIDALEAAHYFYCVKSSPV